MTIQNTPGNLQNDADDDLPPEPVYQRFERQVAIRQISYYISGELQSPMAYAEMLYTLRTASETDVIYLHLNTPGGNFDTGLQIINNMRDSSARVVTVLEARAFSMGALIFLAGDDLYVHDNCQLMFHNYSGSFIGKGNEQHAQILAVGKWFEKVMKRICHPFLTNEEIEVILQGGDLWLDSDAIRKRLSQMNKETSDKSATKPRKTAPDKK